MSTRFSYVKYDEESVSKQEHFKEMFEDIEGFALAELKDSRARSLLMTALEEAYMWAGKAIRDDQNDRRGIPGDNVPERGDQ